MYAARDARTGKRVVIKHIQTSLEAGGMDARLVDRWARLDHKNVRGLIRAKPVEDGWILALDYVPGPALDEHASVNGPLPVEEAVSLVLGVLEGLEALHGVGIVHGDMKPENVLLDGGEPVIVDLGSAVLFDLDVEATQAMRQTAGTLAWMAPEEIHGQPPTPRSDVHAAGAILHRLLTGEHHVPLEETDASSLRRDILRRPPVLEHERLHPTLRPVLKKALAKHPEDRYESALAFASALHQATAATDGPPNPGREALRDLEDQA